MAIDHPIVGAMELIGGAGPGGAGPQPLFCENETNLARLYGAAPITPYPKDGINDHVLHGAATVNPEQAGAKCAFWYKFTVPPGQTAELRLRLRAAASGRGSRAATKADPLGAEFDQVMGHGTLLVDDDFLVLVNSWWEPLGFVLRRTRPGAQWHAEIGSYDPAAPAQAPARSAGDQVTVGPRPVAVLRAPRPH